MASVLVRLAGGEGIIRQADGEIALTHDVSLDRGQTVQPWDVYAPIRLGLRDERMLFGGLLPPGAVSVEAVEATGVRKAALVGGGTYAVIFEDGEHGDPVLGYRDERGAFVHRPMPGEYAHEPVTDAEEPCPLCGHIEYEQYLVNEEWRAGRGMKGTDSFEAHPLIVCRVCGHQEHVGGIMRLRRPETHDQDEAAREERLARVRAERAVQRWYADKMTLLGVTFPIYAAEGWPARINGSGSHGDDVTSVGIAHTNALPEGIPVARPQIQVTTSIAPHQAGELPTARDAFASQIEADGRPQRTDGVSDAAITLRFRADRRRRAAATHDAPVSETQIMIDGTLEPFVIVGNPDAHWVASRRHHDLIITIAARDIDPASLDIEPIADPSGRLLGPEPDEP